MTLRPFPFAHGLVAVVAAFGLWNPAHAQQSRPRTQTAPAGETGQPTLLGTYGDWGAYMGTSSGRKVCFALAQPSSAQTTPPNRPRDPSYLFISTRPAENVRNEVSIIIGYGFKPDSDASVEIGQNKFSMYTQKDGAWIRNAAEEARMVDAMRKTGELVVKGTSALGTQSTDKYSLKGLGQALDRTAQECK
jgi:invasion protein IalB